MSTTNKRISLVTDTEEVTAIKAPSAGLLRESRVIAVPGRAPLTGDPAGDVSTPLPVVTAVPPVPPLPRRARRMTPPVPSARPRAASASFVAAGSPAAPATTPATRPPPAPAPRATAPMPSIAAAPQPAAAPRSTPPRARMLTPVPRVTAPVPIAPGAVASFSRPVVDLVPIAPGTRGLFFGTPPTGLVPTEPKERSAALVVPAAALESVAPLRTRSRAGLYAALIGLLVAGGGMMGWRQWSSRPGRVEITTTPADAIISVGSEALDEESPALLERPPGVYEISVARAGYQHTHRTVELHAGDELALTVALTPAGAQGADDQAPVVQPVPAEGAHSELAAATATATATVRRPAG